MEHGMEPEVTKLFRKILNTISYGLIWMIGVATAGIHFQLGWRTDDKPFIFVVIFYIAAIAGLFFLLRYYYRTWKDS